MTLKKESCSEKKESSSENPELIPRIFDVKRCRACEKFLVGRNWRRTSPEPLIESLLSKHLDTRFELELSDPIKRKKYLETRFRVLRKDLPSLRSSLRIYPTLCNFCSKRAGGYYEAVLQVRSEKRLTQDQADMVLKLIDEKAKKRDVILRFRNLENGFDVEIAPVSFARMLEKELRAVGLSMTVTAKNVSRDNQAGKDIYRVTICARFPGYSPGDFVSFERGAYRIIGVGRKIVLLNSEGKKKRVAPDNFKKSHVLLELSEIRELIQLLLGNQGTCVL